MSKGRGAQAGRASTHQEGVSAKGLDANKAAEVDKVDALQIVQRQLIVEELCKLDDVVLTHLCVGKDVCSPNKKTGNDADKIYCEKSKSLSRCSWCVCVTAGELLMSYLALMLARICIGIMYCTQGKLGTSQTGLELSLTGSPARTRFMKAYSSAAEACVSPVLLDFICLAISDTVSCMQEG